MQKERFADKELTVELRMSMNSKQRAYCKDEVSMNWSVFLPRCCAWIHLTNSHQPCKTVWSAP